MRKRRKTESSIHLKNKNVIINCINDRLFKKSDNIMQHSNMRVLVFAEKASRLRFDSDTIKLTYENTGVQHMTKSSCGRLMFAPQKPDAKIIGNHIFGDAQHLLETGGCKIHHNLNDKIVVSRIFALPQEKDINTINFNIETQVRSAVQLWNFYLNKTNEKYNNYFDTEPPEYVKKISKNQNLSFNRIPLQSSGCTVSYGSSQRLGSTIKSLNVIRIIAIAVTFDLEYEDFIINNISFIDREMRDLQHELFEAFCGDKTKFHYNSAIASYNFRTNILCFHNALRLEKNTYLSTDKFFEIFSETIQLLDTKKNGYFLSKLISSILMFHLSWTITTNEAYYNKLGQYWARSDYLNSKTRPLLTMLGCVGMLSHTTRVVITGKDLTLISKLLNIISYFIKYQRNSDDKINSSLLREINFSQNNLWSFTKAEILARLKNQRNSRIKYKDNKELIAERWQLGEFSALFAQKTILQEAYLKNIWNVRYNYSSLGSSSLRCRTKSEPNQKHKKTSIGESFRPRSTSNPLSKFSSQMKFGHQTTKNIYPDSNHYTIASGKLPYGYSYPIFSSDKFYQTNDDIYDSEYIERKYEYGEASRVWGRKQDYGFLELLNIKNQLLKLNNIDNNYSKKINKTMTLSESIDKLSEPCPSTSKNSNKDIPSTTTTTTDELSFKDKIISPCKSIDKERLSDINFIETQESDNEQNLTPFWKRNRKSSTVLARAMTNNTLNYIESLNPDEIEEIYNERLNDIHYIENTIDDYDMSFSKNKQNDNPIQNLFGAINDKFEPAFILQGINGNNLSLNNLINDIKKEVQHPESFYIAVPKESKDSTKNLLKKDKELEFIQMTSVYILADVDANKIFILSGDVKTLNEEEMVYPCDCILSMLELFKELQQSGSSAMTLDKFFENSLDNILRKATLLRKLIENTDSDESEESKISFDPSSYIVNPTHHDLINEIKRRQEEQEKILLSMNESSNKKIDDDKIDATTIVKYLDCQYSDLKLLINICSIISPTVRSAV